MMEKIIEFMDKNLFFNLYKPELVSDNWDYDAENFKEWDSIHKNKNIDYRNNYYGFVFPSVSSKSDSDFDFGFINEKGEELLEMKFDSASKIVNGISVVKKSNKWFILKVKENIFKEVKYENVSFFSEGLAVVMNEECKYGYINEDGIEVIKCKYDNADSFSEGLAKVGKGDWLDRVYGFINEKGEEIIPLKHDTIESVKEGLICVYSDSNSKYGYLDKKGNVKIPFQFDSAGDFINGFAKVKIEGKWGYIDYNGEIIITCEFEQASDFSDGLALVKKDYDDYFINNKGENVISCDDYRHIHSFNNNLAAVAKADIYGLNIKWGFIDKKGKLIIDCIFDEVSDFCNGFTKVKKDDNWAIMNSDGVLLSEYSYSSISEFNEDCFVVGIPAKSSELDIKEELTTFFNVEFGNKDWQNVVYSEFNHKPTLGIYNAGSQELIALGLGRKDRIFTIGINFKNNKKTHLTSLNEKQLNTFTQYDYADLIKGIMTRFEEIGSLHEDSCYTDDDEVRDGLMNEMNEEIEILRELIPSIPDIDELSPGDF
jgi:hypothetical protein